MLGRLLKKEVLHRDHEVKIGKSKMRFPSSFAGLQTLVSASPQVRPANRRAAAGLCHARAGAPRFSSTWPSRPRSASTSSLTRDGLFLGGCVRGHVLCFNDLGLLPAPLKSKCAADRSFDGLPDANGQFEVRAGHVRGEGEFLQGKAADGLPRQRKVQAAGLHVNCGAE